MLIGQLSKRTGFSRDTIRYYEKIGLIEIPKRPRLGNNYKDYPEQLVQTLLAIRKYKDLGFTLEEIRELLVLQSIKVLDVSKLLQIVEQKITGLDEEIEKLHAFRLRLGREHQLLLHQKKSRIIACWKCGWLPSQLLSHRQYHMLLLLLHPSSSRDRSPVISFLPTDHNCLQGFWQYVL